MDEILTVDRVIDVLNEIAEMDGALAKKMLDACIPCHPSLTYKYMSVSCCDEREYFLNFLDLINLLFSREKSLITYDHDYEYDYYDKKEIVKFKRDPYP